MKKVCRMAITYNDLLVTPLKYQFKCMRQYRFPILTLMPQFGFYLCDKNPNYSPTKHG